MERIQFNIIMNEFRNNEKVGASVAYLLQIEH